MALKRRPNSLLNYSPTCNYDSPEEKSFIDDYNSAEITRTFSYGKIISESLPEEDDFEQIRSRSFGGVVLRDQYKQRDDDFTYNDPYNRNLKSNPTTPVGNNSFSLKALRSLQSGLGSISSSVIKRFSFHGVTSGKSPSLSDKESKIQSGTCKGWNLLSSPTGLHSKNLNPMEGESLLEDDISDYHKGDFRQTTGNTYKDGTDNSNFGWATDANWNLSPVKDLPNPFGGENTASSWQPSNPSIQEDFSPSKDKQKADFHTHNSSISQGDPNSLSKQRKRGSGFLRWFSKDKESDCSMPSNYGLLSNTDDDHGLYSDHDSCEDEDPGLKLW